MNTSKINRTITRGLSDLILRNGAEALEWFNSDELPTEELRLALAKAKATRRSAIEALDALKEALLSALTGDKL